MHQRGRRSHVGHTYGHDITIYSLLRLVRPRSDRLQLVRTATPQAALYEQALLTTALYSTLGTSYASARLPVTHRSHVGHDIMIYSSLQLVRTGSPSGRLVQTGSPLGGLVLDSRHFVCISKVTSHTPVTRRSRYYDIQLATTCTDRLSFRQTSTDRLSFRRPCTRLSALCMHQQGHKSHTGHTSVTIL